MTNNGKITEVKYPPLLEDFEGWSEKKKILVILAHPDDPEFFCGATIFRWCTIGHEVSYCLLTKGQKGSNDITLSNNELSELRVNEQKKAADLFGVKSIEFLAYQDGEIFPNNEIRREIIRTIRKYQPDVIVTSDPQNLFTNDKRINHPDHRYAGQIVVDAIFPGAGNPRFYPEQITEEKLTQVNIKELWITLTNQPNLIIDMTNYFEVKLQGIKCHKSQIGSNVVEFENKMRLRFEFDCDRNIDFYPEKFKRIILQ